MSDTRKKFVVINFFSAFNEPTSGGEQRSLHLLRALAKRFEVHSISPTYEKRVTKRLFSISTFTSIA